MFYDIAVRLFISMPYKITYVPENGGVITTYSGTVTDAAIINSATERLLSEDKIKNYRYFISDYTNVNKSEVTSNAVRISGEIALHASRINRNILLVGVFPTDAGFGMGRMWQAYADDGETGWKTKVVRSFEEAKKWIQLNLHGEK